MVAGDLYVLWIRATFFTFCFNNNKLTCGQGGAMTTEAHNKIKQHSFNAKVNFFLVLTNSWCLLPSTTRLTLSKPTADMLANYSQDAITSSYIMLPTCSLHLLYFDHGSNMLPMRTKNNSPTFSRHIIFSSSTPFCITFVLPALIVLICSYPSPNQLHIFSWPDLFISCFKHPLSLIQTCTLSFVIDA